MAGLYNQWLRRKLADRIRHNGGYHNGRGESMALSWCVRYYGTIDTAEEAAKSLIEEGYFLNEADLTLQRPDFDEWFYANATSHRQTGRNRKYEFACERLQDDLASDDGLRMWSPETAKKYGFDYRGDGADRVFNMELIGLGSGSKHVCLAQFDGFSLKTFNGNLADWVGDHLHPDMCAPSLSNEWCRKLMGIMDELDEALTDENAKRCGQFYETDWLARELGLLD